MGSDLFGFGLAVLCWAWMQMMLWRVKDLKILIGVGMKCGAARDKGVSPFQEGFPAEEDGLSALSLPWLIAAPAPLPGDTDVLFTHPILCPAVPVGWAVWLQEGWELGIPALPALPVPAQPSLPSCL